MGKGKTKELRGLYFPRFPYPEQSTSGGYYEERRASRNDGALILVACILLASAVIWLAWVLA